MSIPRAHKKRSQDYIMHISKSPDQHKSTMASCKKCKTRTRTYITYTHKWSGPQTMANITWLQQASKHHANDWTLVEYTEKTQQKNDATATLKNMFPQRHGGKGTHWKRNKSTTWFFWSHPGIHACTCACTNWESSLPLMCFQSVAASSASGSISNHDLYARFNIWYLIFNLDW